MSVLVNPARAPTISVNIDEVTTVAASYALAGFTTVGSGGVNVQASATNTTGLANAFATAAVLADPIAGATPAALGTSQAQAQQTLDSLANALAACVNTTGPGSAQCSELFACAVPGASFDGTSACSGGSGTAPADTLSAALSVTHHPGLVSSAGVYDTATRNAVFSPALSAAPNDWTLALHFTGGGLNFPYQIAVDATGDLWVTNLSGNSVSEFDPGGTPMAGSPFTEGGLYAPRGLAIDASGDIWVANASGGLMPTVSSVTKLDSSGVPVAGSPFTGGGLNTPLGVAIDAQGNVWVANGARTTSGATELDSSGSPVPGSPFAAAQSESVAIDASGDVWLANEFHYSITKLHADGTAAAGSPFSTGGETVPFGIAIDPTGNLWFGNAGGDTASEFTSSGSPAIGSPFTGGGLNYPYATAVDASGNVWLANTIGNSFTELTSGGAPLSGATGFVSGQQDNPESVAIDASGNVWAANTRSNSISKLIGAATPTRTPLVATITAGEGFAP